MKLLVQSDDFGFTKGVSYGILEAIDRGIVRNTGLFVNMGESSEFAANEIAKRPHVCFGIDFNISSGKCVSNPNDIPNLVDEKGCFIRSTEKCTADNIGKKGIWPYDEVMTEIKNQFFKYVELVGKKPEYFHTHSISQHAEEYIKAISDLSNELGIPFSREITTKNKVVKFQGKYNVKPFPMNIQIETDVKNFYKEHIHEIENEELVSFSSHCGYVDDEIFKWSSYTLIRCKDLEAFTSDFMKKWIKDNKIQLITYRDLENKI